jgi:YVTN family beta-propeller protein
MPNMRRRNIRPRSGGIVRLRVYPKLLLLSVPTAFNVYVANRGSNTVSVIDVATDRVVATIPVGPWPIKSPYSGRWAVAATAAKVSRQTASAFNVVGERFNL